MPSLFGRKKPPASLSAIGGGGGGGSVGVGGGQPFPSGGAEVDEMGRMISPTKAKTTGLVVVGREERRKRDKRDRVLSEPSTPRSYNQPFPSPLPPPPPPPLPTSQPQPTRLSSSTARPSSTSAPLSLYSFLPTSLPPPTSPRLQPKLSAAPIPETSPTKNPGNALGRSGTWLGVSKGEGERKYGVLRELGKGVVLGLEEVVGVVERVGGEIIARGLNTPLLFSTQALDLHPVKVRSLIETYLKTLSPKSSSHHTSLLRTHTQHLRFAHPHELAWFLRWALARVVRVGREDRDGFEEGGAGGEERERGLVEWGEYEAWRGRERVTNYDPHHFQQILQLLPPVLNLILSSLFTLLSRLSANSHISGCTPTSLSSTFGPLLFGLPINSTFTASHTAFVRAAGATEHLLLAFIRLQEATQERVMGGLPRTLREWVKGYPRMLVGDRELGQGLPRKGVKVVRVERGERVVRAYSRDLVRSGQEWSSDMVPGGWDAWDRVAPGRRGAGADQRGKTRIPRTSEGPDLLSQAVLTEEHRKRLDVDSTIVPSSSFSSTLSTVSSGTSNLGLTHSVSSGSEDWSGLPTTPRGSGFLGGVGGEASRGYGSLTDRAWGLFEDGGFDDGETIRKKLEFDLTEGAKREVTSSKRDTIAWDDFASGGFDRTNTALSTSLTFSPPVQSQIESWPSESEELRKKLKKSQKEMVKFDWDTTPLVIPTGKEEIGVVEEGFVDCWADLVIGGDWGDREELTFRESNWVIMEYRAIPHGRGEVQPSATDSFDPRTSSLFFVFEEFVPQAYQLAIANPKTKRSLFRRTKSTKSSTGTTTGSKMPPRSKTRTKEADEANFEAMLKKGTPTKVISLSKGSNKPLALGTRTKSGAGVAPLGSPKLSMPGHGSSVAPPRIRTKSGGLRASDALGAGKSPTSPGFMKRALTRKSKSQPDLGDDSMQFETRTTSGSDPDSPDGPGHGRNRPPKLEEEKWIDILVTSGARRMDTSDWSPATPAKGIAPSRSSPSLRDNTKIVPGGVMGAMPPPVPKDQSRGAGLGLGVRGARNPGDPPSPLPGPSRTPEPITEKVKESDGPSKHRPQLVEAGHSIHSMAALEVLNAGERSASPATPAKDERQRDTLFDVYEGYGNRGNTPTKTPAGQVIESYYSDNGNGNGYHSDRREEETEEDEPEPEPVNEPRPDSEVFPENSRPLSGYTEVSATTDSEYRFEPPPTVADIEAIARQPSPGRYQHGEPLHFVGEEEEEEEDVPPVPSLPAGARAGFAKRSQ